MKIIKLLRVIAPLVVSSALFGCSDGRDCLLVDSVEKIKDVHIDGEVYVLYFRVTGWHDKISFYELYKDNPEFDDCGKTSAALISSDAIDESPAAGEPAKLVISDKTVTIVYSKAGVAGHDDLIGIPIEIR